MVVPELKDFPLFRGKGPQRLPDADVLLRAGNGNVLIEQFPGTPMPAVCISADAAGYREQERKRLASVAVGRQATHKPQERLLGRVKGVVASGRMAPAVRQDVVVAVFDDAPRSFFVQPFPHERQAFPPSALTPYNGQ